MASDIEQIAPTPWKPNYDENANAIDDSCGRYVCCAPCNDKGVLILNRIIACVNFCAGVPTERLLGTVDEFFEWRRQLAAAKDKPQLPADVGFAQVSKLVQGLAQVSQLPGTK